MRNLRAKAVAGLLAALFVAGLGFYVIKARKAEQDWQYYRQQRIAASPKVYVTRTGKKYHRPYHYGTRNTAISMYEATEQGYDACAVCRPSEDAEELLPPLGWYFSYWIILTIVGSVGGLVVVGQVYGRLSESEFSD